MNDQIDGLYISGVWVCEADAVLTFQGNDLTQPDARTASYSNSFTLPDSLTVRDLLQGAEQVDAGGGLIYQQLPAQLIDEGEVIFRGVAEFVSFKGGWKTNLYDSMISFFDAIKKKNLQDLDLSRLDHSWTLDYITKIAGAAEGVVYPLIDYGGIDSGVVPYDTMTPAIYVKDIVAQICKEAGYRPVGDWLDDPLFKALALPFVGQDPKSHDQDWIDDRSARVTTPADNAIMLKNGSPINMLLPLSNDSSKGYEQGKLKPYSTTRYAYVVPQNMRVLVEAQVLFYSLTSYGAAEVRLILERNGQEVRQEYFTVGGYADHMDAGDSLMINTSVDCLKGDELTLRLTGSSRTSISKYQYFFTQAVGDMWADFKPDASVHLGDLWPVSANMPDVSCSDLVLTIAKAMCGTFEVDSFRKTVRLNRLDSVLENRANCRDWSENVDESEEPELFVQIEPYTGKNWCRWKENDNKSDIGYGDGFLSCGNSPNPAETPLFDLPFMASVQSANTVNSYGAPILIKTRSISVSGDSTTIDKNDAAPRLILIEPTKKVEVQTKVASTDGAIRETPVTLTACWFAVRPEGARTESNSFSLAFSPVLGQTEEPLLVRYFAALKRTLRRPRMLTVSMYLQPSDIAILDLSIPIRLQRVRAGSLDLNDGYYYLNKLSSYRSGRTCKATLIAV
ncbi:hypothetical protein [Spirosoma jeollabukense]